MALLTAKAAGGKWGTAGTWENEKGETSLAAPTASDDCILGASSGSVQITANVKCRSLEASAYKKTLTQEKTLSIGTSTLPKGETNENAAGLALKLGSEMTLTIVGSPIIALVGTATTEAGKVTTAGKTITILEAASTVDGAKWQLEDKLTATTLSVVRGHFSTHEKECVLVNFESLGTKNRELNCAGSLMKLSGTGNFWNVSSEGVFTIASTGATIESTDSSATEKVFAASNVGGYASATITIKNNVKLGAETYGTVNNNSARKPNAFTGSIAATTLTVSVEAELPAVGEEITGAGVTAGTVVTAKPTATTATLNNSMTVASEAMEAFAAGLILETGAVTEVTTYTSNGKAGEPSRLASSNPGTKAKLKKASGNVTGIDYQRTKDSLAEGGAEWYAGEHSTLINTTGWKLETFAPSFSGAVANSMSFSTALSGNKVASSALSQSVRFTQSVAGLKVALGSPSQSVRFSVALAGTKATAGGLSNAVRFATSTTGFKGTGGTIWGGFGWGEASWDTTREAQRLTFTQSMEGIKAGQHDLRQSIPLSQSLAAHKRTGGALAQTVRFTNAFTGGVAAGGALSNSFAVRTTLAGRKRASSSLSQSVAFIVTLSTGGQSFGGGFTQSLGFTGTFTGSRSFFAAGGNSESAAAGGSVSAVFVYGSDS